jgi:hypothetical protein
MRNVAEWLQELGLGKYASAFEDNEIDFAALPHLSEKMLEETDLVTGRGFEKQTRRGAGRRISCPATSRRTPPDQRHVLRPGRLH